MQEETDWLDYGARMYQPKLGRWFCVDPHAENYLSWTPYNYVANNPILLIDPNGMDWFYNEITGDVQYVSNLHKGAEKYFEVEGWKWMGTNGMFNDGDDYNPQKSDYGLLKENGGNIKFDEDGHFSGSLFLKGDDAKSFMGKQGYELAPVETYELIINGEPSLIDVPVVSFYSEEVWTKMCYVNNIHSKKRTLVKSDILEYSIFGMKTFNQYNYNERKNKVLNAVLFFIDKISPYIQSPFVNNEKRKYVGWNNYPETGPLSDYKK